jgi:hypothetical protein
VSHPWLRLWADMPTDPKWRTIARLSNQPVASVIAVYLFILVNADAQGTTHPVSEDIASALDVSTQDVDAILVQMQGRVLKDGTVTGWERIRYPFNGRPPAHLWMRIRERIFHRDKFTCTYCGNDRETLECDHVVPVSRGGSHDDANLTTACRTCNRSKRAQLLSEWTGVMDA